MRGQSDGLFLWTRHSSDCQYADIKVDRDQARRCNCVKYISGSTQNGKRIRKSTGTTSWETRKPQH
jgi:hypothetical protein